MMQDLKPGEIVDCRSPYTGFQFKVRILCRTTIVHYMGNEFIGSELGGYNAEDLTDGGWWVNLDETWLNCSRETA